MPPGLPDTHQPLVSVIVPAFNAEETLSATLASVASQTYGNLEIMIVDDGSTDRTAEIADGFCRMEPRAQLICQSNGGVAAARNAGIERASGVFIAPIDSDDLWHPAKVSRQVARLRASPEQVGLVYNWSRIIDENDLVAAPSARPVMSGNVLREHLKWNFVGNGSTPMFRSAVFRTLRYDPTLRAAGHEGCEDFLLQLEAALTFEFACEPSFLTGYRVGKAAMSADLSRMIRSHIEMYNILRAVLPEQYGADIRRQLARQHAALAVVSVGRGKFFDAAAAIGRAVAKSTSAAIVEMATRLSVKVVRDNSRCCGRRFGDLAPDEEGAEPARERP